jgi:urease accessory protein
LLLINKTDLAPHVGASLQVMAEDTKKMRGERPFILTNMRDGEGVKEIAHWLEHELAHAQGVEHSHEETTHA